MALQKPNTTAPLDSIPIAFDECYANDQYLESLISTRFAALSSTALSPFGTTAGTVADGGALTSEIARAQAAEQANATAISTNATAISNEVSRAQAAEVLKAPINSPTFTGIPSAPTATAGTGGTQIATLDFVATAVAAGGGGGGGGTGGVPTTRTLTAAGLITGGGDLSANRTFTVTAASQADVATGTDQTKALTAFSVAAALGAKAPLASPAFVGTPTAPTPAVGTNTVQIATAAMVTAAGLTGSVPSALSASAPLAATDFDRDIYATGTVTLTAPNAGAGWRSGIILNDNALTGIITLAVPSGAMLDGVTNGTTSLYPFQKARVRQTGATSYRTDWIDRTPIVAILSPSGAANADANLPVGYNRFSIDISGAASSANGDNIFFQVSGSGSSGVKSGANDYTSNRISTGGGATAASAAQATGAAAPIFVLIGNAFAAQRGTAKLSFSPSNSFAVGVSQYYDNTPQNTILEIGGGYTGATSGVIGRANLIRFLCGSGTLTANIMVRGEL